MIVAIHATRILIVSLVPVDPVVAGGHGQEDDDEQSAGKRPLRGRNRTWKAGPKEYVGV